MAPETDDQRTPQVDADKLPAGERLSYKDAAVQGYIGFAPGADNDHSVAAAAAEVPEPEDVTSAKVPAKTRSRSRKAK